MLSPLSSPPPQRPADPAGAERLRAAARDLEATFIAEMLRASGAERQAGLGDSGESPFASFLLDARAQEIARAGGIGLAEALYESMVSADGAR
jgi:Rod binding domain-containing protein